MNDVIADVDDTVENIIETVIMGEMWNKGSKEGGTIKKDG